MFIKNIISLSLSFFRYHKYRCFEGPTDKEMLEKPDFVQFVLNRLKALENTSWRRILLIVRALNIALWLSFGCKLHPDYAKCFSVYMLSLPEATISKKDLVDFLKLVFTGHPHSAAFMFESFACFRKVFHESPKLPSPKSLKSLCRCKIRDSTQKLSFTAAISKMQIPNSLEDYLLFLCN